MRSLSSLQVKVSCTHAKNPPRADPLVNRIARPRFGQPAACHMSRSNPTSLPRRGAAKAGPSESNPVKPCIGVATACRHFRLRPQSQQVQPQRRLPPSHSSFCWQAEHRLRHFSLSVLCTSVAKNLRSNPVQVSQTKSNHAKATRVQPNHHAFGDRRLTPHGQMLAIGGCIP